MAQRRHRYVQDGEVPVVQVSTLRDRRSSGALSLGAATAPASDNVGAALAQERAARLRAEQALERAQATIHSLETRLGHAEITQKEALELARVRDQRAAGLQADLEENQARLSAAQLEAEGAEQRQRELEAALAETRRALREAERAARGWDQEWSGDQPILRARAAKTTAADRPAPRKAKAAPPTVVEEEPEPVKWWLPKPQRARG